MSNVVSIGRMKSSGINWDASDAGDIRDFLAGVRPLEGPCYCGDGALLKGRAAIEQFAFSLLDDQTEKPSATQCMDILYFLRNIQPFSREECYGCASDSRQCGLFRVLELVQSRLAGSIEAAQVQS